MSITVRMWSTEELESFQKDKWLATVFMNVKTFSQEEIKYYPYNLRRAYLCEWENPNKKDVLEETIYATDERMLLKFIDEEYTQRPDAIHQVITQYRPLKA